MPTSTPDVFATLHPTSARAAELERLGVMRSPSSPPTSRRRPPAC
jgi:hypothetical protein